MLLLFFLSISFCFKAKKAFLGQNNEWINNEKTFTSGNILITQPNEIYTKKFLAEFTPDGKSSSYYDFGQTLTSNPVDIKFFDGTLYVLFSTDGVFSVYPNSTIKKIFCDPWPTPGDSHFGMDFDSEGNLYVINLGTYPQTPKIQRFSKDGKYDGVIETDVSDYTDILVDEDFIWATTLQSNEDPDVKKYDKKTLKLLNEFKPKEDVKYLTGVERVGDEIYVLREGTGFPDSFDGVTVFDLEGKIKREWNLYPDGETVGSGPSSITYDTKSENLFILLSDPFRCPSNVTQHVQVFKTDGTFINQFGGHECSDLLCQTFSGLEFVP